MSLNDELRGMIALANFPWTIVRLMVPGTVIFVNTHGRILGRARLSADFVIPDKTARIIMAQQSCEFLKREQMDRDYEEAHGTYPRSTGCPELNRKAWFEGVYARLGNNPNNPYPINSNGFWHWNDGYDAGTIL